MLEPLALADLMDDAAFHRRIVESTHDCVTVLDLEGRVLFLTPRTQERLGIPDRGAILEHPWPDIWEEPWRGMASAAVDAARAGRRGAFQGCYRLADGRPTWWDVAITPITPIEGCADGAPSLLAIARDVTTQKDALDALHDAQVKMTELQRQLANVSRLTTLGTFTASIAHELMQPLTAIMTNARAARRLASQQTPLVDQIGAALDDILRDNRRASDIVERFRKLLKRGGPAKQLCDLKATIEDVVAMVRAEGLERRIVLVCQFDDTPPVWGDRVQLQQLVLNLVMNGFDAVAAAAPATRQVTVRTRRLPARGVMVSVENDGGLITTEQLTRLREPFYTTKPEGLGLGLSICREILAAHRSDLKTERRPSGGLTFSFTLRSTGRDGSRRRTGLGVSVSSPAARSSLRST